MAMKAIIWVGIELLVFVLSLFFIALVRVNILQRAILLFIFLVSQTVAIWSLSAIPYAKNATLINSTILIVPIGSIVITYVLIRFRNSKKKNLN